jgi:hypothetical protein
MRLPCRQAKSVGRRCDESRAWHGEEEGGGGLVALGPHPVHRKPAGTRVSRHLGGSPKHRKLDSNVE